MQTTVQAIQVNNVRYYLTDSERLFVERIIQAESGNTEPFAGQMLIAQCILNACERSELPPSKMAKYYGYTNLAKPEDIKDSVKDAVVMVFDKGYEVVKDKILFYYAPKYTYSSWHESQRFVIELSGHRFFALKE